MKRVLTILFTAGMIVSAASFMFTSCTKEGPQGPPGVDGQNGQDANATCTQCHNFSELIVAKIFQYDASQHATGSTTFENATNCAPCHTSQGFLEVLETGEPTTAEPIQNAAPINCRTCHMIHETYTTTDWNLRAIASFTNLIGIQQDMTTAGGDPTGNLCARCHQSRVASPVITDPTSVTDSLKPTSKRYGPHHGPQSLMLAGIGGYETGAKFTNSFHTGKTSCIDCHGADAVGNYTGGHSYRLVSEEEGDNFNGCNMEGCHVDLETFDYDGKQTIIEEKLLVLLTKMQDAGVMDADGYVIPNVMYCQKMLATVYNFKMVEEDRSMGVHNFDYANGMLDAGIAYLESLGY